MAKERSTVDLDDFERRLRRRDSHQEDPLAELARLVGETNDPYGEVFAQEAVPSEAQRPFQTHRPYPSHETYDPPETYDDRASPHAGDADRGSPRLSGDFAAIEAGLRGTGAAYPSADPYADESDHEFYAQHAHYARHDGDYARDEADQSWPGEAEQAAAAAPAASSRRPLYAIVATVVLGLIGVGVAFAYKGASSSPGEIKTIAAASGPTKIQPPAETSKDQDAQDAAILGKGAQPAPSRLVNGEEQPVDIPQAVQENASRDADAGGPAPGDASSVPVPPSPGQSVNSAGSPADSSAAAQTPSFGLTEMPAPKKVKVVSVRPDGTIMPGAQGSDATPSLTQVPPQIDSSNDAPPKSAATQTKTTSRVAAKPAAGGDDGIQTPAPKPVKKAKPKKLASIAPSDSGTSDSTASPVGDGGGFAVQLAAPGSEAEARSATARLAKKFAASLGGRHLGVHKAQSNGKSVFRVRVSSLSKEDAVSLCEKLKADGGSCFVAKN